MIAQLTRAERNLAMAFSIVSALPGLTMAALGNHDPMAVHGFMALAIGLVLVFAVGGVREDPAPDPARLKRHYDDPIKIGILLAMVWGVFAMAVCDRCTPSGMIFAFGGMR